MGEAPGHTPVLMEEVLRYLNPQSNHTLLDCTCGAGGHSEALLQSHAQVIGVDRDAHARALASERLSGYGASFRIYAGTFASAAATFIAQGQRFSGVLADLGVSSMQLDDPMRGFGIRSQADADMRMGDEAEHDALTFIDQCSQETLAQVLRDYGEERMAGRVARHLKEARARGARSAAELADAVRSALPGRHQRHPALRTFQALRIAVNGELEQLRSLLDALPDLLEDGGRAVLISFHSLEDRMVKYAFRDGRREGVYSDTARKVVTADSQEIARNRRASSAKLRWAIRAQRCE
ncbi:MAG: 16S rRNA (cytosine(1402)-N(4))-methyltransferase RsmH [Planctomycetota bacterium]|nr:MAG: 16S rRNA (cytosine(1402)-N(4))-methyltransferase RsmH [Planctomycetota bacterium]